MTSEQLKNMKELYASKRFAHFPLEFPTGPTADPRCMKPIVLRLRVVGQDGLVS